MIHQTLQAHYRSVSTIAITEGIIMEAILAVDIIMEGIIVEAVLVADTMAEAILAVVEVIPID